MSKYEMIKNVVVFNDLSTTTDFTFNIGPLSMNPDICIVRSISYAGQKNDVEGTFLIWSDIANDYIGSFATNKMDSDEQTTCINLSPQTVILTKQPIMNNTDRSFKIHQVDVGNKQIEADAQLYGDFSITLEFVTYKK